MRMRLTPGVPARTAGAAAQPLNESFIVPAVPPPWKFVVTAADGTELLVMHEENGLLAVEGDESRWDEGAKRFLHGVMQWSGQAGITWKDEARRTGESRLGALVPRPARHDRRDPAHIALQPALRASGNLLPRLGVGAVADRDPAV
jgi:hypothetical protein